MKHLLLTAAVVLMPGAARAQFAVPPSFGTPGGVVWGGGGLPGISNSFYNAGWSSFYPLYPNGYSASGPILFPGWAAVDPPKARPTLYPAIPLPDREVIAAAIYGDEDAQGRATIEVLVPRADARVYIDDTLMKQTGMNRTFKTPPLKGKTTYSMTVRVTWDGGGSVSRTLHLQAGERERLDLRSLGAR